ncbi:extradiol dioxygenase [Maribacter sp. PR1]|uniref:VOC family protein n=1 Tax=Maribacter cobaltidurans TaxID=1178778 RepID=A0ABU7IPQ7_9FLAO|nr:MULTISPECIES: VOC family protein [Maribacter]MDC6387547.1 extradiol dioxygenase [Maribacter sp. PR1]MEE1974935.1 VOC family protein [Maribacter cobaltidurans]
MKSIWLNLPVKNVQKSKSFFKEIGFKENPMHANADNLGSFLIGEHNFVLMLFPEYAFQHFSQAEISDTSKGSEILINIDAQSKEEVDEMAKRIKEAGGKIFANPSEVDGWMYAMGFTDLDGHRWSLLFMEMDKMPK